ncbi:MAG: phenylalanine--tRNA ligase beta subunit [Phycisphaeraceae bacterium]|nr:MAG: phenylalanine--tRNA ligase beta subunit [Phycisphaeraceae bacterium]
MDISLAWLNRYLDPAGVSADEADALLTDAGFPIEGRKELPGGDVLLDVEVTSNRGDCLSHVGCAREIAAAGHRGVARSLVLPEFTDPKPGAPIGTDLTLDNRAHDACPRFTARLIRNVKVGPSPEWLVTALESLGSRSINNVVDVTNFVTFELGNPCHVFDHAKLAGGALIVRNAKAGEKIKTLYEGEHELKAEDVVVADSERPQSLAGVIGGHDSQVDAGTTTVVFEMATWTPAIVRAMSRRMNIRTDAAFRFERRIDPRTIDFAARRAVALICELTGGELADGVLDAGPAMPEPRVLDVRAGKASDLLGVYTPPGEIADLLTPLGFVCQVHDDAVRCEVPPHRSSDVSREADLIEEIARARSLDAVPMKETLEIRAARPQPDELAERLIANVLTGLGMYETVTFSFTSPERGELFRPRELGLVAVDAERRKAEPTLRPSLMTGLLGCRRANQDAGVEVPGGVRLFEVASVFGETDGKSVEPRKVGMLIDVTGSGRTRTAEDMQNAARVMRGAIDSVVRACGGSTARVEVTPAEPHAPAFEPGAFARVQLIVGSNHAPLGYFGVLAPAALAEFGIDHPCVGCELGVAPLTAAYPPKALAHELPRFPGIDRDLSLILDEGATWASVSGVVASLGLERLVGHDMVGVYRGKNVGSGRKSVTVRLFFRDPERTMRREEVDPQIERFSEAAKRELSSEIRV